MNKITAFVLTVLAFSLTFFSIEYPKFKTFDDGLMHIYYMDVGQGDSTLIKLPSKKLVLIDAGPKNNLGEIISKNIPFTKNKIDLVVISHSHADHIAGLEDVLANYEIGCLVYDMEDPFASEIENYLRTQIGLVKIKVVSSAGVNTENFLPNDCFSDPDINIKIYSLRNSGKFPHTGTGDEMKVKKNQNLESNIVFLEYHNFESLFTGDAEIGVQTEILPFLNGNIEVLKSPHHGSNNAFYPPLIEKLLPDFAVFSVGKGNSYGHPHKEVLKGYTDLGVKYVRTDYDGTVEVETDGYNWSVALEKDYSKIDK